MIRKWATEIRAICANTGELRTYAGPCVEAPTAYLAQQFCENNGLGYCKVVGELIAEIPYRNGQADFENIVDYEKIKYN